VQAAGFFHDSRKRRDTVRSTIDCVIAALAIQAGAFLLEKDRDFAKLARVSSLK